MKNELEQLRQENAQLRRVVQRCTAALAAVVAERHHHHDDDWTKGELEAAAAVIACLAKQAPRMEPRSGHGRTEGV